MNLAHQINSFAETLRCSFARDCTFNTFKRQLFGILINCGRQTITALISSIGRESRDWTADYRLHQKAVWEPKSCFDYIFGSAVDQFHRKSQFVPIAIDEFATRKTGKCVPHACFQRDPRSPPFRHNLMWGHRFIHASLIVPLKDQGIAPRGLPIRMEIAPYVHKPGKGASEEVWEEYKEQKKRNNLSWSGVRLIHELRESATGLGIEQNLLMVGDGSYCNTTLFKNLPKGVDLLVRCRGDAKLCGRSSEKRRFYDTETFTPRDYHKPENWDQGQFFWGGDFRRMQYAEKVGVYWRKAGRQPLRLITVCGLPYRGSAAKIRRRHRQPIYLLTTDLTSSVEDLIQAYLDRWSIEVNHRELKTNLGLGQAQVWNERSVDRVPQLVGLAYSISHYCSLFFDKGHRGEGYLPPPKWYRGRLRPTMEDIKRRLRRELVSDPPLCALLGINLGWQSLSLGCAA